MRQSSTAVQPVQTQPSVLKRSLPSAPGSRSAPRQSLHCFGLIMPVRDALKLAESGATSVCTLDLLFHV